MPQAVRTLVYVSSERQLHSAAGMLDQVLLFFIVLLKHLGAPIIDQQPIVLDVVQTQKKKIIPVPKSLESEHNTRDNRWRQTNLGESTREP